MRLVPVPPHQAGAVVNARPRVLCCVCGQWAPIGGPDGVLADLDGEAFKAYYHPACAPTSTKIEEDGQQYSNPPITLFNLDQSGK